MTGKQSIRYFSYLLCTIMLCACGGQKTSTVQRPSFSADSAYSYIEAQMNFGPRVPNGKAHTDCALYLMHQLRAFGAEVELQKGQMPDYAGRAQAIFNVIGHFNTNAPGKPILLCAHYDTRPWCDEEEEYENRFVNVPGANDGASGVGVLLEVARQIGDSNYMAARPVDIIFFDCEDGGTPAFYTGAQKENTWCLGSQLWAIENRRDYQFGILLDMVGAPDAQFPREMYSMQYAENYLERIWRAANALGYGRYFVSQYSYPITDDHYYVNTLANIPCVDIIHYDMRNQTGFPEWWHTRQDDMRNIDKATLQAVGEVVMEVIK